MLPELVVIRYTCYISDKARAVGGSVLEAVLALRAEKEGGRNKNDVDKC